MERLGLGRTPIREALRTLAQEKLVEVYPAPRHLRLAASTSATWPALSEVRAALESSPPALRPSARTPADREVARALLAELPRTRRAATSGA